MSGILGGDLEAEILVRLPAKSLMRFKCVQRSWNILFKNPKFVIRNMHIHMSNDDDDHHRFVIIKQYTKETCPKTHNHNDRIFDKPIESTCLETHLMLLSLPQHPTPTPNLIKSLFPKNIPIRIIKIYGHCNGILCLEYDYDYTLSLILWNPTTREVHFVPPHPASYIHPEYLIGFGAKHNTNDFKVVKLNVNREKRFVFSLSSLEIYNLRDKSWTIIHNPTLPPDQATMRATMRYYSKRPNKYNILVNGIYHWITGYNVKGFSIILCFDFSNNKFHTLTGPTTRFASEIGAENVTEINGSLAYVVQCYHPMIRMRIWVMDKLNGWTKLYNFVSLDSTYIHKHAICKGKKNGVQFLGGKPGQLLTLYDHHGNSLQQFQIVLHGILDAFLVHEYVKSIAPLSP
ncbi:putative F-box domain-containing protein [Medicago truncatula]|uniref:F-box protein interaction domain protein n=1 Tax=Medicago truncatula TaxID=3880 RepID=A0A072VFZ3_MEDTR|nr:F-box/kelch-repeat protein At3g06240 [Medicago truncatula]KEH40919.1 F-box protein interaction domain protein [Medicago truncatula]RHN78329.1 putative F-box domain-containing protein [Medicago truncatula]